MLLAAQSVTLARRLLRTAKPEHLREYRLEASSLRGARARVAAGLHPARGKALAGSHAASGNAYWRLCAADATGKLRSAADSARKLRTTKV